MICSTGRRGVGGVVHSSCEPPGRPRRRAAVPRRGRGARGVAPGAGHLARAGRSCSPPADGTKASASSGLHTSSAPSTPHVFAPTLAALVAMMLTTHERMPVLLGLHSVVRCLVGVRGPTSLDGSVESRLDAGHRRCPRRPGCGSRPVARLLPRARLLRRDAAPRLQ